MSRKYQGRYCGRFYCQKRAFNACCQDCWLRTRGCQDACKNHPDRCGQLCYESERICGPKLGLYRLIPTIAADPNLDPLKHTRGGQCDAAEEETEPAQGPED